MSEKFQFECDEARIQKAPVAKDIGEEGAIDVTIRIPYRGDRMTRLSNLFLTHDLIMSVTFEGEVAQAALPFAGDPAQGELEDGAPAEGVQ